MIPDLVPPLLSFDPIERDQMNQLLLDWGHRMGAVERPQYRRPIDFALSLQGRPAAVIAADTLIRETCGLTRSNAFELSRLCADPQHPGLCSLAMRLLRAFAYPLIRSAWGTPWAISYQDAASAHRGNLYRYDGWVVLGYSKSGSDSRSCSTTAKVRHKVIWGWNAAAPAMAWRRANPPVVPAWAERLAA